MAKAKVKFFNVSSGYGFLIDEETGKEIFVHRHDIDVGREETFLFLNKDDTVEYSEGTSPKGSIARGVKLVEKAPAPGPRPKNKKPANPPAEKAEKVVEEYVEESPAEDKDVDDDPTEVVDESVSDTETE